MIGFYDFLHYLTLMGVFVLAIYCVWVPFMWIVHDLWLDRYRAKQVMCVEYRDGGYNRIESECQLEIDNLCASRLNLNTKVGFRIMNSTIGMAFSIGNDVWLPSSPSTDTATETAILLSTSTSSSTRQHGSFNQSIELTDDEEDCIDVDDDVTSLLTPRYGINSNMTNSSILPSSSTSNNFLNVIIAYHDNIHASISKWITTLIAWALRHVVMVTYRFDQYINQLFPNHPLVILSPPYQTVVGICPVVFSTDRFVSMWLLKRRLYFVKYNTAMVRGILMSIQYIFLLIWNSQYLVHALIFSRLTSYQSVLSMFIMFCSFPFTQYLLDQFHHARADQYACRYCSDEEIKGGIRFIDAESKRNDICKFFCVFIFAGVLWPTSRSNALIRIAKLKLILKHRRQQESLERHRHNQNNPLGGGMVIDVDDIDQFMDTPQYAEQLHRMAGMLDHSIMSVLDERRSIVKIFSSPIDTWNSTEISFRGLPAPIVDAPVSSPLATSPATAVRERDMVGNGSDVNNIGVNSTGSL